jgi:signal transduction histidine kinase
MKKPKKGQFDVVSAFLKSRRKLILLAWRSAAEADPEQTTVRALTRGQFNDHIPEVLDAFERKLCARPGGVEAASASLDKKAEEVKHGLHRWQQGYRLHELMREWGHLQLCLFEELETFAATHPEVSRETITGANRQMITLVNEAIAESAAQFERMQRAEASGQLGDLKEALVSVNEIERRRAALIHQAVHDLNSNVFSVSVAANLLGATDVAEAERVEFAALLKHGVKGVTVMLGDLMDLARLEAGQESREITVFDAAALAVEVCEGNQPFARGRNLFLETHGAARLSVEGDRGKVRRLLQNLLSNALKYTEWGGVIVSWGAEKESWWLMVKDTGPGLLAGPGAPMVVGLQEATASARESDEKVAAKTGQTSHVLKPSADGPEPMRPSHQQPGEGIGLSIVKRLCELLDASLEMASSAETGTTFRVVLPRQYQETRSAGKALAAGRSDAVEG